MTIIGSYLTDNWRAFRTWGVSAISPWEYDFFWKPRPGVDKSRQELKVDWEDLQRPGFSADYIGERTTDGPGLRRSDWVPTADGQAILRNNLPLLAYIAGKPEAFTSKDHNFCPGETVEKQLVVINNSRELVECDYNWSLDQPKFTPGYSRTPVFGAMGKFPLLTGEQKRPPLKFTLPPDIAAGKHTLYLTVRFSSGETQNDAFTIDVMTGSAAGSAAEAVRLPKAGQTPAPQPAAQPSAAKIALFDPKGETAALLKTLRIGADKVQVDADLSTFDVLVIGKGFRRRTVPDRTSTASAMA